MAGSGNTENQCSAAHKQQAANGSGDKSTLFTAEEDHYDIKHLAFDIELSNLNANVGGNVTTTAVTTINNFSVYAFELDALITVDSVKINNVLLPVVNTGAVRKVTLNAPLPQNTTFKAQVFYHGAAAAGNGQFFSGGLNPFTFSLTGTKIMYSLSDPYGADDWWPCKQSILDKIDSVDMWVTIPGDCKVGSNGMLKNITAMPGGKNRYEWKSNYAIDYYLISVAVGPFSEHSYYMHYTDGSNDSMLVQNYITDSATTLTPRRLGQIDSTGLIIDHFSTLFGRYPFDKEKYGHCLVNLLMGGMEHQTMTTIGPTDITVVAHELGHQWWGDHVTYGTWRDIWLSEGLASYTEHLFVEHFYGAQSMFNYRTDVFNRVMAGSAGAGGSVYVDDTTSVNRIFSSRLTYDKGASVTHMLRYIAPEDSLFFKALKQYQQQYAFGNAITTDFKNVFEQAYAEDLDTFFRQWVYGEGYPTYSGKYYQQGTQVYVQLDQTTSKPSSVPVFWMPVELKLKSATGDTIVKVYNDKGSQTYVFTWGRTLTGFEIDPNNHIINKAGTVTQDASITGINTVLANPVEIFPNPAIDRWYVMNLPSDALLILTDVAGRIIWWEKTSGDISIPAEQLPRGNYILSMMLKDNKSRYYRLAK